MFERPIVVDVEFRRGEFELLNAERAKHTLEPRPDGLFSSCARIIRWLQDEVVRHRRQEGVHIFLHRRLNVTLVQLLDRLAILLQPLRRARPYGRACERGRQGEPRT